MSLTPRNVVLALCLTGLLLVLFSEPLGLALVRRPHGSNGYSWSPDEARRAAEVLRWLGAFAFSAGLVERIVQAIGRRGGPADSGPEQGAQP